MGSSSAVYRNKLKERDPQKYAEYLRKQRELSRKSRMALKEALQTKCPNTDALEKKAHQLALARERQARYNAKKRTSGSKVRKKVVPALKSPTVKTDANSSNKSQREYWTMIKRKQRATMSDQQRALEKQKDRERKAAKRAKQMQHNDLHVPTVPPMGPIAFPVGSFSSHVPKAHRVFPSHVRVTSTCSKKGKMYHCMICGYSTTSSGNFCRHEKNVHEQKKVECEHCGKQYGAMYDLRQHKKSVHENIKLVCEICAMVFNNRHSLRRHKILKHSDKPKYMCDICGKYYFEFSHYQGHMNMHSNARPYVCSTCGKDFSYKNSLLRHQLACSNTDMDRYICKVCGKGLKSAECLRAHIEGVHGPKNNICICGKAFSWKGALIRHRKTCMLMLASTLQ